MIVLLSLVCNTSVYDLTASRGSACFGLSHSFQSNTPIVFFFILQNSVLFLKKNYNYDDDLKSLWLVFQNDATASCVNLIVIVWLSKDWHEMLTSNLLLRLVMLSWLVDMIRHTWKWRRITFVLWHLLSPNRSGYSRQ